MQSKKAKAGPITAPLSPWLIELLTCPGASFNTSFTYKHHWFSQTGCQPHSTQSIVWNWWRETNGTWDLFLVHEPTPATKMLAHMGTEMEVRVEEFTQVNELERLNFYDKVYGWLLLGLPKLLLSYWLFLGGRIASAPDVQSYITMKITLVR